MPTIELNKVRIENTEGTKAFYPHTSTDIVFDKQGRSVEQRIEPLHQDNLLINSDFRSGIINQKSGNFEGITKAQYTIDMWILEPKGRDTSLYPQSGKLAIYQDGTNQDFNILQFVYGLTLNQEYHLHFRYNDMDYECNLIANSTSHSVKVNDNIDVLLSKVDSKYTLAINFRNQQSNFIECIKLEKGSFFTGMPTWNYEDELSKCVRKYISFIGEGTMKSIYVGNNYAVIPYELPFKITKKPSVVLSEKPGITWQNHDSAMPVDTPITSAMIEGVAGNTLTVKAFGNFGNATWKLAYMHGFGIAFDFNDY